MHNSKINRALRYIRILCTHKLIECNYNETMVHAIILNQLCAQFSISRLSDMAKKINPNVNLRTPGLTRRRLVSYIVYDTIDKIIEQNQHQPQPPIPTSNLAGWYIDTNPSLINGDNSQIHVETPKLNQLRINVELNPSLSNSNDEEEEEEKEEKEEKKEKEEKEEKEENLTCPVCLESCPIRNIINLNCNHKYCYKCTTKLILCHNINTTIVIPCPLCRTAIHNITTNSVKSSNYILMRLVG